MQVESIQWDDVRIFLAVARHKTLAAAGKRLGIDPTTVARRIARLEQTLSQTLFEHRVSGHSLTSRGQSLLEHAEAMESAMISATGAPDDVMRPHGVIRLSVSEGFAHWVITPRLHQFAEANPGISVELIASTGFLNPSRREADLSIMLARPKKGPLIVRKLTDYRLGLYGDRQSGVAKRVENEQAIAGEKLVGYVPDLIYSPELRYLDEIAPNMEIRLASTSITAQANLIENGAGIGILPCFIGEKNPALVRLLADQIDIERSFWLVMHRDLQKLARIRIFIDWLSDEIAKDPAILGQAD